MTRFWEDTWLGDKPLSHQYPNLYNIAQRKQVSVASVLALAPPPNIVFRRALTGIRWIRWLHLVSRLMEVWLTTSQDEFKWGLTRSRKFTVKSMYLDLLSDQTRYLRKYIWKMKVPLKIKIFMWFLHRKVILTKDNLTKRNWNGCKKCCFCDQEETMQHMFISCSFAKMVWRIVFMAFNIKPPCSIANLFGNWLHGVDKKEKVQIRVGTCALLWAIWNIRNDIIFNNAKKSSFMQVIPLAIHSIRMWSYLQATDKHAVLDIGCNRLLSVARDLYNQYSWRSDLRITS